ncbi:MAG: hypothetical protein JKY65_09735 [Planctomycetes bacterium]|nr:hypothetical protein [Planctomycetota bacterium]
MKTLRAIALWALLSLTGCGTIGQAMLPGGPLPFGGVRLDLVELGRALDVTDLLPGEPRCGGIGPLLAPFPLLDLPLSLALDLALLPVAGLIEFHWALSSAERPTRTVNPWASELTARSCQNRSESPSPR